ncbi:MAG: hypothetical protein AABW71_00720 [Nanoarchaeota archaeon]
MNKMKGGIMKNTNIVLTVFLIATLLVSAIAGAVEVGDIISADPNVISAASVAASISAVDAVETEIEVENEVEFKTTTKNTVSKGQGWIVTESKGALAEILFVSKEGTTADGTATSISKGWFRAGNINLKLESTANTETTKTFQVTGGDGSVKGTLTLTKGQTYQTGFAVWNGDLDIMVGDKPFDAKVTLAIEEKNNRKDPNSGRGGSGSSTASGTLVLGGESFTLEGKTSSAKKLEFRVIGSDGAVGELNLESRDSVNYAGKIEIEGKAGNEIKGKATAQLKREVNTLYGPIKIELDGSSAADLAFMDGTIKIALSEKVASDSPGEKDKDVNSDLRNDEDTRGSNSDSSDRGFWKRFFSFFGN